MLVHHFDSKDELIASVMDDVRRRLQSTFASIAKERSEAGPAEMISQFWCLITSRKQLPYMRLLFEVQMLAIQNPKRYARYLSRTSGSWLAEVEHAIPPGKDNRTFATLNTAVLDGLLLELLSTGDRRRTSEALALFMRLSAEARTKPGTKPRRNARMTR